MALQGEAAGQPQEAAAEAVAVAAGLAEGATGMTERCQPCTKSGKSLSGQEGAHPRPDGDARQPLGLPSSHPAMGTFPTSACSAPSRPRDLATALFSSPRPPNPSGSGKGLRQE